MAKGEFRQDLLYRLDVLELNLPPLRNREEDVLLLLQHYIHFEHERTGCHLHRLSERAIRALTDYPWPGNIREMKNFCERICILCQKECADLEDVCRALPDLSCRLPAPESSPASAVYPHGSAGQPAERYDEPAEIRRALALFRNNRTRTAQYLGIHPSTLWRKMKRYGITAV